MPNLREISKQSSENPGNKGNSKILLHFMITHLFSYCLLLMSLHIISLFITRCYRRRERVRANMCERKGLTLSNMLLRDNGHVRGWRHGGIEGRKNGATARRVEGNIMVGFFWAANTAVAMLSGTLTLYFVNSKPLPPSSTQHFQSCCLLQTFKNTCNSTFSKKTSEGSTTAILLKN